MVSCEIKVGQLIFFLFLALWYISIHDGYITPDRHTVGGKLLKTLYFINWNEGITILVTDSKLYGVCLFGDGATIKTIPMINALAAGVNNPFCLLDVFDCSEQCSKEGKKDTAYHAKLFLPLIHQL